MILSLLANQSCKSGLTTVRHADSIDPRKRSRTVFNDITNISLEQGNGTQVINKRPKKVNDNMRRSNPSPGETADKEEESEEDDSFAIEGEKYINSIYIVYYYKFLNYIIFLVIFVFIKALIM